MILIGLIEWVSSFLMSAKNKVRQIVASRRGKQKKVAW